MYGLICSISPVICKPWQDSVIIYKRLGIPPIPLESASESISHPGNSLGCSPVALFTWSHPVRPGDGQMGSSREFPTLRRLLVVSRERGVDGTVAE